MNLTESKKQKLKQAKQHYFNNRLENFLIIKYKKFLHQAILANRTSSNSFCQESSCDELIIGEKELFSEFIAVIKKNKLSIPNPELFNKLIHALQKDSYSNEETFKPNFFIEKHALGNNKVYRVLFDD